MGQVKEAMIADESRGYFLLEGDVCRDCILDDDLLLLHDDNSITGSCDYCDQEDVPVVPAELIQDRIMQSLSATYEDINDAGAPYDSREGGWQISNEPAEEIIFDEVGGAVSDEFCSALANTTMGAYWCERDWQILSPLDRFKSGWKEFCFIVRHVLRFSFVWAKGTDDPHHPDHTSPALTLDSIGYLVDRYNLVKQIEAGTEICRVRVHKRQYFNDMETMGMPDSQYAGANRMSPAGIPMFYGSADFDTAIEETWDGKRSVLCSKATFRLKQNIQVIDLESLPPIPGYWSNPGREKLAAIRFIHDFAKEISEPADRGSKVDLHYAPTQIISEYLTKVRYENRQKAGMSADRIHGIIFKSSKSGKRNYALNFFYEVDYAFKNVQNEYLELVKVERQILKKR